MLAGLMASQRPYCQKHSALSALYLPALVLVLEVFTHPGLIDCFQKGGPDLAREEDNGFCLFGVGWVMLIVINN